MATKEEARRECLSIVKNELVAQVLTDKYFLCDENQQYFETTPQQMWKRLAVSNAKAENSELQETVSQQFYNLLENFKFVPGGRVMYGLGNPYVNITLKNCYIFKIQEDSMKGIFDCGYWMAETYKTGGGCGIDISPLRPKGSSIRNAARFSGGATNFMDFYSNITGMIGQMGRIGACLMSLDVSHPDVEDFIKIKGGDDLNKVRYANISLKVYDEFMQAVSDDKDFALRWGGKAYRTIKARQLWDLIQQNAWRRAEPGVLFWDAVLRGCPSAQYDRFRPVCTNPCGEVGAGHGDSCNLGSINLSKYVVSPWDKNCYFDYTALDHDARLGVRFLDNIITLEKTPLDFQQGINDDGRRTGLGIMGLADVFMKMSIKFDTDEAIQLADKITKTFSHAAYDESCNLAIEKGPFPAFEVERHLKSEFIQRLPEQIQEKIKKTGIRNIAIMAIAPTGSISTIAQCSSAIEPAFMIHYVRKTNLGTAKEVKEHEVWHETARQYVEKFDLKVTDEMPQFFVGAYQVDNNSRIELQSTVQKYIDQSISNTFNLSADTTPEQIGKLYMNAWRKGLKGVTVYRDGSREGVLVSKQSNSNDQIIIHQAPKRPDSLDAKVHIIKPNGKTFTIFVGLLNDRVYEVFVLDHKMAGLTDGMSGKIVREKHQNGERTYFFESGALLVRKLNAYEDNEASIVTRLVSTALRHGTPLEFVIDQMVKSKSLINSLPKAIAKALSLYMKQEELKGKFKCEKCGSDDIHFEGTCYSCRACGASRCS